MIGSSERVSDCDPARPKIGRTAHAGRLPRGHAEPMDPLALLLLAFSLALLAAPSVAVFGGFVPHSDH